MNTFESNIQEFIVVMTSRSQYPGYNPKLADVQRSILGIASMYQLGRALCLQVPMTFCFLFQRAIVTRCLLRPSSMNTSCFVTGVQDKDSPSGERGEDKGKQLLVGGKFVFPFLGLRTQDLCASCWRSSSELWGLCCSFTEPLWDREEEVTMCLSKTIHSSIYLCAVVFSCLINFTLEELKGPGDHLIYPHLVRTSPRRFNIITSLDSQVVSALGVEHHVLIPSTALWHLPPIDHLMNISDAMCIT